MFYLSLEEAKKIKSKLFSLNIILALKHRNSNHNWASKNFLLIFILTLTTD